MSDLSYASVIKVPEPTLTPDEVSAAIGRLTMTCESLRADIVALEKSLASHPASGKGFKAWLAGKFAK